jgi:hypothetical protein
LVSSEGTCAEEYKYGIEELHPLSVVSGKNQGTCRLMSTDNELTY